MSSHGRSAEVLSVLVILSAATNGLAGTVNYTVTNFSGLQTAVINLGSSTGVIELSPGTFQVTSAFTVPSNVTLLFKEGAVLAPTSGGSLTMNASIQAGRYQIFDLTYGTFAGTSKAEMVFPEWFYTGGSWHTAIQTALNYAGKSPVVLGPRTYDIDSIYTLIIGAAITVPNNATLQGTSSRQTIIRRNCPPTQCLSDFHMLNLGCSFCTLRGLTVDGGTTPPPGAKPSGLRIGIIADGTAQSYRDGIQIDDVISKNNLGTGMSFTYLSNARLTNVELSGNWGRGINFSEFSFNNRVTGVRGTHNSDSDIIIGWGSHSNVISEGVFDAAGATGGGNTSIWMHMGAHDNLIQNVRIGPPDPSVSAYQGIVIWNSYKNRISNVNISGYPLGVLLRSDSISCYLQPPPGSYWDDDTRDNILSNVNIDAGSSAASGIRLDAYNLNSNNQVCSLANKRVIANIFSHVTIDGGQYGVWATSEQAGTDRVTGNSFRGMVFHNVGTAAGYAGSYYRWGNQLGNMSTAWTEVTPAGTGNSYDFQNSWVNFATYYQSAAFYKDVEGVVHLKGLVKNGVVNWQYPIFVLPPGYRPLQASAHVVVSNNALGRVTVSNNGNLAVDFGSSAFVSLDGITFRVDVTCGDGTTGCF